jgi:hypothetical protein
VKSGQLPSDVVGTHRNLYMIVIAYFQACAEIGHK